jgi:hypothetical protein
MSFRHGNCAIDPKGFHNFLTFDGRFANRPYSLAPPEPPDQRVYMQLP